MLDIVKNNPFRILGVFANASRKDVIASKGKLSAFARIGKQLPCTTDLNDLFPSINRTVENLNDSEGKIALPKDWLLNAQFWFVNCTTEDKKALDAISSRNVSVAIDIWTRDNSSSSVHNRIVYYLVTENYIDAFVTAEKLYCNKFAQLTNLFIDNNSSLSGKDFFVNLCEIIYKEDILDDDTWNEIYDGLSTAEYKECINNVRVNSFVNTINDAILVSSSKRNNDNGFEVGTELVSKTNKAVDVLENVLGRDNAQCQLTFDKLSNAILGHGIAYYNSHLSEDEVASKVLPLFQRSYDLAVSKMQEERSRNNLNTIKEALETEGSFDQNDNDEENIEESEIPSLNDFLKKLIKVEDYILGITSYTDLEDDGYDVDSDLYHECEISEGITFSIDSDEEIYDNLTYNFDEIDDDLKISFNLQGKKTFAEWKELFRNIGFLVYTETKPYIYDDTYFRGSFNAVAKDLNLRLEIDIFERCNFSSPYDWIENPIYKIVIKTDLDKEKPYLDWFDSIVGSSDEKINFIRSFVDGGNIILGKSTVLQMRMKGYDVEDKPEYDWRTISLPECTAYDNDKTGIIDEIYYNRNDNREKFSAAHITDFKSYLLWKLHFINLGFIIEERAEPVLKSSSIGGYSFYAKISMTDKENNICITAEFSNYVDDYIYASICECYISRIMIRVLDENKSIPCLERYNDKKSYGIYGEKTMKQLVYSPLGDANIDSRYATFEEIKSWIRQNGTLELSSFKWMDTWCYFRRVPTKYRNIQIKDLSVSHDSSRKLYIMSFDMSYGKDGIYDVEDAIDFSEKMVTDLKAIGFSMISNRLNEKYDKFKSSGSLGNIEASVQVTDYSVTAKVELWIKYNI